MAVVGVKIGATGSFQAIPLDDQGNVISVPEGFTPVWTSFDPTYAPVVASSNGLTATVTVPSDAPSTLVGTSFSLSVYVAFGETEAATGFVTVPYLASDPTEVLASFNINQTS